MSLEMLKRIPRGRRISAPELQEQLRDIGFDRDLRTIQRQLEVLTGHFEIERDDRSKPYGYRWKELSKGLSLPGLNEQESVLLTLAEQHLRNLLPDNLMRSMEGFFSHAKLRLEDEKSNSARMWQHKVRVVSTTQRLLPPKMKKEVFQAVSNALYADHWLEVTYVNAGGELTESKVMPLGMAQQGTRLLLVCRFEGYDDERSLSVHRIRAAKDTRLTFTRPPDFSLERHEAEGRFGFSTGKHIKLVFCLPKLAGVHLTESPLAENQTFISTEDGYQFAVTVTESEQLKWWLRGFGRDLHLVRPRGYLDT
ncbi:helix-turn-helix transcriptional regulator [Variovorax sp. LT1P1]